MRFFKNIAHVLIYSIQVFFLKNLPEQVFENHVVLAQRTKLW